MRNDGSGTGSATAASTFTELGFGTAPLGNLYRAISDAEARGDAGGRLGRRRALLRHRAALRARPRRDPAQPLPARPRPRDDYVLSTKVGRLLEVCPPERRTGIGKFFDVPSRREVYDYSYDGVMRSVEASLERLGVDRIDILFVHDLDVFTHGSRGRVRPAHRPVHGLGLRRAGRAARRGRDPRLRRRHQRVAGLPAAGRARRLRPVPARRPLHPARAGGARELPAALRGARHRHRARRPLQLRHPRHRRRSPAPSTTTTPRRRRSSSASAASRRSAAPTACR